MRKRVVNLCPVRQSCYVTLARREGGEGEWELLTSKRRDAIEFVGATFVSSRPRDSGKGWLDTFRIPLKDRTLGQVAAMLRSRHVYEEPTYGVGSVVVATGRGELAPHQRPSAAARKLSRQVEQRGDIPALLCALFGSTQTDSLPRMVAGDYPHDWEDAGYTVAQWLRLCASWDDFATVFHAVHRDYSSSNGAQENAVRLRVLETWIKARLKVQETLDERMMVDSATFGREDSSDVAERVAAARVDIIVSQMREETERRKRVAHAEIVGAAERARMGK